MSLLDIRRPRGRGHHRAADEVERLRRELAQERLHSAALIAGLWQQLQIAKNGWDTANAKASQYRDERDRAVEATRQNQQAVSSLTAHPAVTETQPIPVLTLHEADRWGYLK